MRFFRLLFIATALLIEVSLIAKTGTQKCDFSVVCSTGQTLYFYILDSKSVAVGAPETQCIDVFGDFFGDYKDIVGEDYYWEHYNELAGDLICNGLWREYDKPQGKLVIPEKVKHNGVSYTVEMIAYNTFTDCDLLTSVSVPGSVKWIMSNAFFRCNGLQELIMFCNTPPEIIGFSEEDETAYDEEEYREAFPSNPTLYVGSGLSSIYRRSIWGKCLTAIKEDSKIVNNNAKQKETTNNNSNAGNSLSKGAWRTQMKKVLLHPTQELSNGKYKGLTTSTNVRYGIGVYWWDSDYYYWGEWKNNNHIGFAIDIASDYHDVDYCKGCAFFVGNYADGGKSGKGKCYDKDGNLIYYGDFSNDRPTGTYPSTEKFTSNKFECIEYKSGDKYVGETYNGQRHGQGIYLWKNGDAWYGSWKDGDRNGYGILLYYNGDVKYGRWEKDTYYTN